MGSNMIALGFILYSMIFATTALGEMYANAPTSIIVKNSDGSTMTSLSVVRYTFVQQITLSCSETDVKWTITPNLPSSMSLRDGTINGQIDVLLDTTLFNITATNSAGSVSLMFPITSTNCPHGLFLYPKAEMSDQGMFKLMDGQTEVYSAYISNTGIKNVICLPYKTYDYSFNCAAASEAACILIIMNEEGMVYQPLQVTKKQTKTGKLEMIPTTVPTPFIQPNPAIVVSGEKFNIFIEASALHGNFTFIPNLPETVSFVFGRSSIQGVWNTIGKHQFTVTCSNSHGSDSFVLEVNVDICEGNLNLIQLNRIQGQKSEAMNITNSLNEVLMNIQFSGNKLKMNLCVIEGTYMIHMYTTEPTGWYNLASLVVRNYQHDVIGMYTVPAGIHDYHQPLIIRHLIPIRSILRYYRGSATGNWKEESFKDSSWKEGNSGSWGSFDSSITTICFRKSFSLSETDRYGVMMLNMNIEGVIDVYVNGIAMISRSSTSTATWIRSHLPTKHFKEGKNVIAVILKRLATSSVTSSIQFDIHLQPLFSNDLIVSESGNASDNLTKPDPEHLPSKAFDLDPNTYWQATVLPATLTYVLAERKGAVVNRIVFYKLANTNDIPLKLQIVGINDDGKSTILSTLDSLTFFKGSGHASLTFNNEQAYSTYSIVFITSRSGTGVRMSDIRFYTQNQLTCKKQMGQAALLTGQTHYKKCAVGKVGVRMVHCIDQSNQAIWVDDRSSCVIRFPSHSIAYVDTSFQLRNVTFFDWKSRLAGDFQDILLKYLTVKTNETQYSFVRDLSNNEISIVEFTVRFTLEEDIGDYVQRHTKYLLLDLNDILKKKYQSTYPYLSIEVTSGPSLYVPIPWGSYVWNTFIVVFILFLLTILYLRSGKKGTEKTLKRRGLKGSSVEKSDLLASEC